jgi:hypothetical protein
MQSTLIFVETPASIRGRVLGILTMCIGTMPIGMLAVGLIADWIGAARAISVMTLCGMAVLTAVLVHWREMR